MTNKYLRIFINVICLIITGSTIIYTFIQLHDNPLAKIIIIASVIVAELVYNYSFGLTMAYNKIKDDKRYMFGAICTVYLLTFAIPSAIVFFTAEMSSAEQIATNKADTAEINKKEIKDINEQIVVWKGELKKEAKTGIGSNMRFANDQITTLTKQRDELKQQTYSTTEPKNNTKTAFLTLQTVYHIPANVIKIIMFGVLILFSYIGQGLNYWQVPIEKPKRQYHRNVAYQRFREGLNNVKANNS
jgi:hypothetical protein